MENFQRRRFLRTATRSAALVAAAGVGLARAQGGGAVTKIVVPYGPGGTTDNMARLLADSLSRSLNTTVIVENRPGASGLIGTRAVQFAPPDGRSIFFTNAGFASVPLLQKGANYDPLKDFQPLCIVGRSPTFLMVNSSVPAHTLADFVAYAKTLPDGIEAANSGLNTGGHVQTQWFAKRAGIKVLHVPYKGAAETANALISGEVKMQLTSTTEALNMQVRAGKVRPLAIMTEKRDPLLAPGVPTMSETLPGVVGEGWYGLLLPAAVPQEAVRVLSAALKTASADPTIRKSFVSASVDLVFTTPEQMREELSGSVERWKGIVKELEISAS